MQCGANAIHNALSVDLDAGSATVRQAIGEAAARS
jgi:hypothetical protein